MLPHKEMFIQRCASSRCPILLQYAAVDNPLSVRVGSVRGPLGSVGLILLAVAAGRRKDLVLSNWPSLTESAEPSFTGRAQM